MSEKRVAVVTGGGTGIGAAIAKRLAGAGCAVAVLGRRIEPLQAAAEAIRASGGDAEPFSCDVSDEAQVTATAKKVLERFGRCDIIVNNAGLTRDGLFIRMSAKDFDDVINTNLRGAFLVCRALVPGMLKARWGRVINISSTVGLTGNPGQVNYSASKSGLIGMTKSLALELARRNVTVNAVAPGFIETDMTAELNEAQRAAVLERIPAQRFAQPDDIAGIVAYLASDEASYVTGEVIRVDGGLAV